MKKALLTVGILIIGSLVILSIYLINQEAADSTPAIADAPIVAHEDNLVVLDEPLEYEELYGNVLNAGPPKDGIPPIDEPNYMSLSEALETYSPDEPMFIYESSEGIYLYPQSILVWHEIVNDTIGGESVAITYCPLTGSAICYANLENNTFGTSGSLLNSNLVMYDRLTESYIPQILGVGISDDLEGTVLNTRPVHWTTLSKAMDVYEDAKVLTTETGFFRDYNRDPYGSYEAISEENYYNSGEPFFPLMNDHQGEFQSKYVVVAVKSGSDILAVDPLLVKNSGVLEFEIGDIKAVAFYDHTLDFVRVFNRDNHSFTYDDKIVDENGNVWHPKGFSEEAFLEPLTHFDVMWFAWYAFYPETEVIK